MTKDEFIALYEREETDGDTSWRSVAPSPDVCAQLLAEGFPPETLLLSHRLPAQTLAQLAQHPDPRLRRMVADKRAAAPILDVLANDQDPGVRIRVCYNAKVQSDTLDRLTHDPVAEVREAALTRLPK